MSKTPAQRARKHGAAAVPMNQATARTPQRAQGNANLILIAASVATAFLFAYFHLLTLNQMTQLSGGLAMPDSLYGGFDPAYVESVRHAMNADALGQLQFVHKTAGTLFPLIFAFTAMTLVATQVARKPLRWALWAPPMLFAIVQLWANVAIDTMLGAATLTEGAVTLASVLVVLSWVLLALSLAGIVVALVLGRRRRRPVRPRPVQPSPVPRTGGDPVQ
ncbi:hypothetical protein [Specibacter cremeus]|uniref:hypothetical protein n=1 Tax=Specibacter cremeus TaxID=1629051 RepID=UPI001F0BE916|nr:hypothetical protein [Specibacter cremeus]